VLLDFWTYGCINCRHVQPRLKELESRFADSLTVIGVHAGKFAHERVTKNLASACDRQNVTHAVVNDRQYRIWRSYSVQAWPTVALIGPDGELISVQPGEFALEPMARAIETAISSAETHDRLVRGPDPASSAQPRADGLLRFPGRVLIDGQRLVIADTGHGRVLDCVLEREPGADMSVASVAAEYGGFLEPQGLALLDGALWVADRAAQAVWRIDPGQERVRALGTGNLAERALTAGIGPRVDVRRAPALATRSRHAFGAPMGWQRRRGARRRSFAWRKSRATYRRDRIRLARGLLGL
jgi:thiol-disulfide isomerase/thioredoxin